MFPSIFIRFRPIFFRVSSKLCSFHISTDFLKSYVFTSSFIRLYYDLCLLQNSSNFLKISSEFIRFSEEFTSNFIGLMLTSNFIIFPSDLCSPQISSDFLPISLEFLHIYVHKKIHQIFFKFRFTSNFIRLS